jgi:hypothetical protein
VRQQQHERIGGDHDTGEDGEGDGKCHRPCVEPRFVEPRNEWSDREEQPQPRGAERYPEDGAGRCEGNAFDRHEAHEPRARRSERRTQRQLVPPPRRPHQGERRHIRHRDQQHEQHRGGEDADGACPVPQDHAAQRVRGETRFGVGEIGPHSLQPVAHVGEILAARLQRHTGLEPADDEQPERPAPRRRRELQHWPEVGPNPGQATHTRRQDPDDGVGPAVDHHALPHHRGAAQRAPGKGIAHDHDGRRAHRVVGGLDRAPDHRPDPEGAHEPRGHRRDGQRVRIAARGDRHRAKRERAHRAQRMRLALDRLEVRYRVGPAIGRRVLLVDPHQLLVIRVREATERRRHHTEDGGGGADPETEHEDRGDRVAGAAQQDAGCVAQVRQGLLDPAHTARVVLRLAVPLHSTEGDERLPPRLLGCETLRANEVFGFELDVLADFVGQLAVQRVTLE